MTQIRRLTLAVLREWQRAIHGGMRRTGIVGTLFLLLAATITPAFAQYSAGIQGMVLDPSGAGVPNAQVKLTNAQTAQVQMAKADSTGRYRFLSLAPGQYALQTEVTGFAKTSVNLTLDTNQNLEVPINLTIGSTSAEVTVTGQPPVLDTAETRNELTIDAQAVDSLPLPGRNMISLVTMAPGVTGLGVVAGGSPGSAGDNFSTETQVDTSANGQGAVGNMYIVDGLDVSSAIRPGVLNLTPNPIPSRKPASRSTRTTWSMAGPVRSRWR